MRKKQQRYLFTIVMAVLAVILLAVVGAVIILLAKQPKDPYITPNTTTTTEAATTDAVTIDTQHRIDPTRDIEETPQTPSDTSSEDIIPTQKETEPFSLPHDRSGFWISYAHGNQELSGKSLLFSSEYTDLTPLRLYHNEIGILTFYNDTDDIMDITFIVSYALDSKEDVTYETYAFELAAGKSYEAKLLSDKNTTAQYSLSYKTKETEHTYITTDQALKDMNALEHPTVVYYNIYGALGSYSKENLWLIPRCNVTWPKNKEYEYMAQHSNILTMNEVVLSDVYQIGGDIDAELLQIMALKDKNDWIEEKDIYFDKDGNLFILPIPYNIPEASLINVSLSFQANGSLETWGEGKNKNGTFHLLKPFFCKVTTSDGKSHVYKIIGQRAAHAIPVVYITTQNGKNITSKNNYLAATFMMDAEHVEGVSSIPYQSIGIKGRGHSTWKMDKKPYALKFTEKVSVMGLDANKDWVLLANYFDPSNARNYVAYEMAKELPFRFTPSSYPVDVFLNGVYIGVYCIGEKIEVASSRVDLLPNNGQLETDYLIEIGAFESGQFTVGTMKGISITYPKPAEITKEQRAYVINYLNAANNAVKTLGNYEDYIDMNSFLDWFIMIELTYNCDSSFNRSVYITKKAGGKLEFQPLWDFDLGFGNLCILTPQYETWATTQNGFTEITWATYLLKDEHFRDLLQARWEQVSNLLLQRGLKACDQMSAWMNAGSGKENFDLWVTPGERIGWEWDFVMDYTTTEEHIDYVRRFIQMRKDYLDRIIINREEPTTYIKPEETQPVETSPETTVEHIPPQESLEMPAESAAIDSEPSAVANEAASEE